MSGAPAAGRLEGIGLIVFTLLSWASVPLFLRVLSKDWGLDPFSANGWRYGISAVFWLPFLFWAWKRGRLPRALLAAAAVPVAFNIVGQSFFAWGPKLLDPGFFSFVFRVQVVFVTLGAYFLFPSERGTLRSPRFWAGLLLVVLGSVGLIALKPGGFPQGATLLGIVVALASGILFAGYGLAVRYYVSQYPPVIAFGVICQFTALGVLAVMFTLGERAGAHALTFTGYQWFILVLSAFVGIAISHVTYYASITRLGVSVSIGIIQLQPIFTAMGSLLLFDEQLVFGQWMAGLVGVCGALLMLWTPRKPAAAAAAAETGD